MEFVFHGKFVLSQQLSIIITYYYYTCLGEELQCKTVVHGKKLHLFPIFRDEIGPGKVGQFCSIWEVATACLLWHLYLITIALTLVMTMCILMS